MNVYLTGTDVIGAEVYYGPVSPQQLAEAKRPLTADEQKAAAEWKSSHPSFLQREAFGGMKGWQVLVGGAGLIMILGGMITLIVRRR